MLLVCAEMSTLDTVFVTAPMQLVVRLLPALSLLSATLIAPVSESGFSGR
jgi:hypothetical protein